MPLGDRDYTAADVHPLVAAVFHQKVSMGDPDDCWMWKQSSGSHGYGQTWDGKTVRLAHRVAYVLAGGTIPAGQTIDHICRNIRCCNPSHLRVLSNLDNARDNGQGRKTHCPSGHPYDKENTYIDPGGGRRCRECAVLRRAA